MRKLFLITILVSRLLVQGQDICQTTRELVAEAQNNFASIRDISKRFDESWAWFYPVKYSYVPGEKGTLLEIFPSNGIRFRQIIGKDAQFDYFINLIEQCLSNQDAGQWKTTEAKKRLSITWENISTNVVVQVYTTLYDVFIAIYRKDNPYSPPLTSKQVLPLLMKKGFTNYMFVRFDNKIYMDNKVYHFAELGDTYAEGLLRFRGETPDKKYGFGFIDSFGKVVISPIDCYLMGNFSEGVAWGEKDYKYFFIDKQGRHIIPPTYDYCFPCPGLNTFKDGISLVVKENKFGYIDKTGKVVIPLVYDKAFEFMEGLAAVKKNGKWGFIDREGKEKILPKYDSVSMGFKGGLCAVQKNKKWGLINSSGKELVLPKFVDPPLVAEGMAGCSQNKLFGFLDSSGRQVVPLKYQLAYAFQEGVTAVKQNGKWGYIDKKGKVVIPFKYTIATSFVNGYASVSLGNKWGLIDRSGKEIIPIIYESALPFSDGLSAIQQNGKWGYADKNGQLVIYFLYDFPGYFKDGKAMVRIDNDQGHSWFFIDKYGREFREKYYSDFIKNF